MLPISKERMLEESEDTVYKLNSVSDTISEISKSYEEAAATTIKEDSKEEYLLNKDIFIDTVLEKMETEENNLLYEDIVTIDNGILDECFDLLQEKQELFIQDIIEIFEKHNCYIIGVDGENIPENIQEDLISVTKIINSSYKIDKAGKAAKKRVRDNNKNIWMGLNGVSKAISNVANEIEKKNKYTFDKEREEIEVLLMQKNIGAYDIKISRQDSGRMTVDLYTRPFEDMADEVTKIQKTEEILSKVFDQKMVMQKQKNGLGEDEEKVMQTYVSEDKFKVTVAISGISKHGSEANGDSNLRLKLDDGKLLLALSDGMGSGKEASKISSNVIKSIKKLMSAGFSKESATELINTIISMKAQNETFASLDISTFDLYNGKLEILKNYACPTYIKSGKEVKLIHAISLPTGILSNVDSVVFDTDLNRGDIVIMCTDGILEANKEAVNKEEGFKTILQEMKSDNVKKMADIILQEAIDQDYGKPHDDMTVIVAKIS